jgi:hypothetical protein
MELPGLAQAGLNPIPGPGPDHWEIPYWLGKFPMAPAGIIMRKPMVA